MTESSYRCDFSVLNPERSYSDNIELAILCSSCGTTNRMNVGQDIRGLGSTLESVRFENRCSCGKPLSVSLVMLEGQPPEKF